MTNLITWTCHICGHERPDDKISVFQSDISKNGDGAMLQNVRYCNDKPDCTQQATTFELIPGKPPKPGSGRFIG